MTCYVLKTVYDIEGLTISREVVYQGTSTDCLTVARALTSPFKPKQSYNVLDQEGLTAILGGPRFLTVSNILDARYIASSLTYRVNTDKTLTREQCIDMGSLAATYADMAMVK